MPLLNFRILLATMAAGLLLGAVALHAGVQPASAVSSAPSRVDLFHDPSGWTLRVDGQPLYVKAVNWSYTPVGQKYDFNRWALPDEVLQRLIDEDAARMQSMGINAVRLIGDVPPRWISYLHQRYGIYSIMNHFAGRYGIAVNGSFRYPADYSDPATRAAIIQQTADYVRKYKDVPGVLAFAFGNEGNYGLEWKSSEIENLPVGERQAARAKHLYTLLDQVVAQALKLDPNHPAFFVNGDLQYLDLIAANCPSIPLLGVNAYRGRDFTDLWSRAEAVLHKPVLLMEFGCDAFNARTGQEDQDSQAVWLRAQLLDMQRNARSGAGAGTCLGGAIFEWADEWWKFGQEQDLDVHNTQATWANGGYSFDFVAGKNNMNEEWWGLCSISPQQDNGLTPRTLRRACDAVRAVWGSATQDKQ